MTEIIKKRSLFVRVRGYVTLVIFIIVFSGVLKGIPFWETFDFSSLVGQFGIIKGAEGDFTGTGGVGAEQGFMLCVSLLPTVMLSLALVELAEYYGALDAASTLFTPVMRFIMGVPGCMAISLVGSLNSSDVGSVTARDLYQKEMVSERELAKMIAFQYPACGLIANLILLMATGGDAILISMSLYLAILLVLKFLASNFFRLLIFFDDKRQSKKTDL